MQAFLPQRQVRICESMFSLQRNALKQTSGGLRFIRHIVRCILCTRPFGYTGTAVRLPLTNCHCVAGSDFAGSTAAKASRALFTQTLEDRISSSECNVRFVKFAAVGLQPLRTCFWPGADGCFITVNSDVRMQA